jgi:hypothetical protein
MGVENVPFGCGLVDSPEASIILKSTNMKEIFKDIPGYEGLYQVSNFGNVKSLSRELYNGKVNFISKEKMLKAVKNKEGYYVLNLFKDGKQKTMCVHVLLAIAFLNHIPNGHKIVVDHINNIKTDNRLENLQLISHRENCSKDRKGGSSKYIGVFWSKKYNKWIGIIVINRKQKQLGYFNTEHEAHLAYQKALEMYNNGDLSFLEPKKYSSQYKGVSWFKIINKWMAYIRIDGKKKHLGYFTDEYEAHLAYQKALTQLL